MAAELMVGRAGELSLLDGAIADVSQGRSRALALLGEPGIGKTRLLAELRERSERSGQLVLSGSASELEYELPFWVFVDALDEYVRALASERLGALDDGTRAELAHVLPSLAAGARAGAALADERYRTHRAMRRLLEVLAAGRPLVLALDDLHWADSGSIELLASLLHRPPAAPVVIAVGMRPRQAPARLSAALERAHRAGVMTRLELEALSVTEARSLLGAAVDDAVYRESGGNPFYLQQLVRFPDARTVAAALTEELAALAAGPRRLLEGAAVAGDPFEPELAAAAAGAPEASAMDALDELIRRDLVRTTDVPRRFRFRHPLVRQAVYEAAPGAWRLGAHERCAAALAARGAPASARAHHVEHAARHGDAAAIAVLREAGEAVAQRNPAGAAHWFATALRLLGDASPPDARIALLTPLAGALAATGRFAEAREALLESLRVVPAGDVAGRVQLASACAGVELLLGRYEAARQRLADALAGLEDPSSSQAVALMIHLAVDAYYRVEYSLARDWAARALDAATPLGERPLIAAAGAVLALATAFIGPRADAERHCSDAAAHVDAMSDAELATAGRRRRLPRGRRELPRALRGRVGPRRARARGRTGHGAERAVADPDPDAERDLRRARPGRRRRRADGRRDRGRAARRQRPRARLEPPEPVADRDAGGRSRHLAAQRRGERRAERRAG